MIVTKGSLLWLLLATPCLVYGVRQERSIEPLIVGGREASQKDFPWIAALYWSESQPDGTIKREYKCAGTLISRTKVLTAAHCGFNSSTGEWVSPQMMFVALGKQKSAWDASNTDGGQTFAVHKFLRPTEYRDREGKFNFDVALVVLRKEVVLTDNVSPAILNILPDRFTDGLKGKTAGWGETGTESVSDDLLYADVPFVNLTTCRNKLSRDDRSAITFDKFCGGFIDGGAQPGRGDSGSGLVYQDDDGVNYVVGIVSTRVYKRDFNLALYTNVSYHSAWITSNLNNDGCKVPPPVAGGQFMRDCASSETIGLCLAQADEVIPYGAKMSLQCTAGYSLRGTSGVSTCAPNNKWSPPDFPTCAVAETNAVCGKPPNAKSLRARIRNTPSPRKQDATVSPWTVGIYWIESTPKNTSFYHFECWGSLISETAVLTAAQCVFNETKDTFKSTKIPVSRIVVIVGKQKQNLGKSDLSGTQTFPSALAPNVPNRSTTQVPNEPDVAWTEKALTSRLASKYAVHPDYKGYDSEYRNDFTVITLRNSVPLNDKVYTVCLPTPSTRFGEGAKGKVTYWSISKTATNKDIRLIEVQHMKSDQCRELMTEREGRFLTVDKFCGGTASPGLKISFGNCGSGLIHKEGQINFIVGLVSTSLLPDSFLPTFYLNVRFYSEWIKQVAFL